MVNIKEFMFNTKQELKYYVYALTYKENGEETVFYIGKGKGNRVFSHFGEANELKEKGLEAKLTGKHRHILEKECFAYIIQAGLTEEESFKIESTLIDMLSIFKRIDLQNLVDGQHTFGTSRVELIDSKYSEPIDLEAYCQEKGIRILGFKINREFYNAGIYNDHRGILEGLWKVSHNEIEKVDYVIALHEGLIYGVYKYKKGSVKKLSDFNQKELDEWNFEHNKMGRLDKYTFDLDKDLSTLDPKRSVLKLTPVTIQPTQSIKVNESKLTNLDLEVGEHIFNKNIVNGKTKTQNPVVYYGKKKEA